MESWNEQLKTKILESEFSIKEISDKTKIPTKFIEAIEKADFKNLPAEIFAKSQIERLFKFLGIDPSEALKDYEEFISPPEIIPEEPSIDAKLNFQNLLNNLNFPSVSNSYLKYGGILFIAIILLFFMFDITDDEEIYLLDNLEKKNDYFHLRVGLNKSHFLVGLSKLLTSVQTVCCRCIGFRTCAQ